MGMFMMDTYIYKCGNGTHAFQIIDMKDVDGKVVRDIPDNKKCECGKVSYGDLVL